MLFFFLPLPPKKDAVSHLVLVTVWNIGSAIHLLPYWDQVHGLFHEQQKI